MKTITVIAMALIGVVTLTGCGRPVEQNEVCLVLHTLGDRTNSVPENVEVDVKADEGTPVERTASEQQHDRLRDNILNARADLVYAKRAPFPRPGVVRLFFDLGKHAYVFSQESTFESSGGEEFVIDCVGGKVHFDFCVHMYLDRDLPDLKDRLLLLTQDYQLRQYSGSGNVLGQLVRDRFKRIIREPLQDYSANKNPIDIMRSKDFINEMMLKHLNKEFGRYGIVFTMAAIHSPIRLEIEQQQKMNEIVQREYQKKALDLEIGEGGLKELETKVALVTESSKTEAADVINSANAKVVSLVSEARKRRRTTMLELIGEQSYIEVETMLIMVENLKGGETSVSIVPSDSQIWIGESKVPVAAK